MTTRLLTNRFCVAALIAGLSLSGLTSYAQEQVINRYLLPADKSTIRALPPLPGEFQLESDLNTPAALPWVSESEDQESSFLPGIDAAVIEGMTPFSDDSGTSVFIRDEDIPSLRLAQLPGAAAQLLQGANLQTAAPAARPPGAIVLSTPRSNTGYIDSAIVSTQLRFRFDAAYGMDRADRAEFFYGKYGGFRVAGPPDGPNPRIGDPRAPGIISTLGEFGNGLAVVNSRIVDFDVDFQEFNMGMEYAFNDRYSHFVELPFRFLNPNFSANTSGMGDMGLGFKYALIAMPDRYLTFQFRTYLPTGEALAGLGNDHVSIEPGLLYFDKLTDRLTLEAEFRPWIPIGGSSADGVTLGQVLPFNGEAIVPDSFDEPYASEIIRYGLGFSYDWLRLEDKGLRFTPVVELVGWEVLGGFKQFTNGGGKNVFHKADSATGDSIVNLKFGMRVSSDAGNSLYAAYGQALTDEKWYNDTFRLEYRRSYGPNSNAIPVSGDPFIDDEYERRIDKNPRFKLRAGGVFLDRYQADTVFATTSPDQGDILAPDLGFQSGIKLSSIVHHDERNWEFGYLGIFSGFDFGAPAQGLVNGSQVLGSFTIPTNPSITPLDNAFYQNSYVSTLNSLEVNVRQQKTENVTLLGGLRWLNLDEDFDYGSSQEVRSEFDFARELFGARNDVNNNLFGLQVGADTAFWESGALRFNGLCKAGVFHNHAEHRADFRFSGPLSPLADSNIDVRDQRDRASFFGECEIVGTFEITERLALRMGYQLMWLDGVALGPEQIAVSNRNTGSGIDASGSVFWHGGLAQIETTW